MKEHLEIDLARTKQLLVEFLQEKFTEARLTKAIVGLSGGIDSAVSAYLSATAFGPENVHCVLMPYKTSSESSITDAQLVVNDLGCPSETVDITPMVKPFADNAGDMDRLRLGNVMARTRMIILYDRSARYKGLVIGTGNKTETLLGYSTIHGDGAFALNPIGELYKTQIRALAAHLGVPESIISKPPSADLWDGQSDEDELGFTYENVDRLLYHMVDENRSDEQLIELGFDSAFVTSVRTRMQRQEFKRRMPPVASIRG